MSVIITPIDFVRQYLISKYPTCVELKCHVTSTSITSVYTSIKDAKQMLNSGATPVVKSSLHIGNLNGFKKYMVLFDSVDYLRELLSKKFDSEDYIEHQLNMYVYERLSFAGSFQPVKFDNLDYFMVNKVLSGKQYNTRLTCCRMNGLSKTYFKNKYDTSIPYTYHTDVTYEYSSMIGLLYDNTSGEVIAPVLHLGNGYMLARTFACDYNSWTTRLTLSFNGYQFNLGHYNLELGLSDEEAGLTVLRIYMPFTTSKSCKLEVRSIFTEHMSTLDVGFDAKENVKIVKKDDCGIDLTWFDNFIILDDKDRLVGFRTFKEIVYIEGRFQNRILRKMFTHTMFSKNMSDDLTIRYA